MRAFLEQMAEAHYGALPVPEGLRPDCKIPWADLDRASQERSMAAVAAAIRLLPEAPTEIIHAGAYCEQRSSPIPGLRDALEALVRKILEEAR